MENLAIKIVLNVLGIVTFFLIRFLKRKNTAEPSMSFWIKDNKWELLVIALIDVQLMIFVVIGGLRVDLTKLLPSLPGGVTLVGDLALPALCGWIISFGVYEALKKKVEDSK